jgi:hypothetical protein
MIYKQVEGKELRRATGGGGEAPSWEEKMKTGGDEF